MNTNTNISKPDDTDPDNNFRRPLSADASHRRDSVQDTEPLRLTTTSKRKNGQQNEYVPKKKRTYGPRIEDWRTTALIYDNKLTTSQRPRYPRPTSTYPNPESTYRTNEYPAHTFNLPSQPSTSSYVAAESSYMSAGSSYMTAGSATPAFASLEISTLGTPRQSHKDYLGTKDLRFKPRWLQYTDAEGSPYEDTVSKPITSSTQDSVTSRIMATVATDTQMQSMSTYNEPIEERYEGNGCIMCQATYFCRKHCKLDGTRTHKPCCLHGIKLGSSTTSPITERTQTPSLSVDTYRSFQEERFEYQEPYIPMAREYFDPRDDLDTEVARYPTSSHDMPMLYDDVPE